MGDTKDKQRLPAPAVETRGGIFIERLWVAGDPVDVYRHVAPMHEDGTPCDGLYIPTTSPAQIQLKHSLNGTEMWDTLIHELVHAVIEKYGMQGMTLTDDVEENVARQIGKEVARALVKYLRPNYPKRPRKNH